MDSLFDKWKEKIPKYDNQFKVLLFDRYSKTGGSSERAMHDSGKQFSNNYELYIYAFFLGLYNNIYEPIPDSNKKTDFSMPIKTWGSKTNVIGRNDFTNLQEYIFISLVANTDIDFVALEQGKVLEDEVIRSLMITMESFTNGGLIFIQDKMELNSNYFLQPTAFLNLILESSPDFS